MRCLILEGCVEVQGYLYSKPVPASEIIELLDRLSKKFCQAAALGEG
jgi:EAL domain-containing protein (putative c-di-GMP-specific phosphodiesterase class I)